jgi:meso-butanediol dehydrogenase / (S,S)-butanediol dehydrogenase / diacetyl reductase
MDLAGKVAIVTGAARGLGLSIALELAKAKMKVVVVDLDKGQLQPVVDQIKGLNAEVHAIEADVSSAEATQRMASETLEAFGQIDVLVNNAGIIAVAPFMEETEETWDKIMSVNLKGTLLCCKAVTPHMIERKSGRIVNISSIAGKKAHPLLMAYSVSKHGVIGITQALAQGLGEHNITVNAVCPGVIETAMWTDHISPALATAYGVEEDQVVDEHCKTNATLKRAQTPEDIGRAVSFLCKEDNISGIALTVDGGLMCFS